MSKNLIIGVALGYSVDTLKPFVLSLRRYYQDYVVFVVNQVSPELEDFCAEHRVHTFIPNEPLSLATCIIDRHRHYHECISENFEDVESVLLADIRDIVFQDNPFKEFPKHALEFFSEPEVFKNCKHNSPWIAGVYGQARVDEISNNHVICCGTTMGSRAGILQYLETMIAEINRIESTGRKLAGGEDQPVHNHLVYDNRYTDFNINHTGIGPISTMHHSKTLTFNRSGQLLNDDGSVVAAIHQYDRCGSMSVVFVKNALNVTGKSGIRTAANYVANNFAEHDIG
jgi:hypothetical protein